MESGIHQFLIDQYGSSEKFGISLDPRIFKCLKILRSFQSPPAAVEISKLIGLSESRFLHLFKKETGITYRRMILWFRLEKSFRNFRDFDNLTELAHHCGFADSARYARPFKKTFGVSPRELLGKHSRFIQVSSVIIT